MAVRGLAPVAHHVKVATTFAPGRPALWLGLRTATATALALLLGPRLDPVAATWAPLAAFGMCLVDRGGAYRTRAYRMAVTITGSLIAVVVGSLLAGTGVVAVIGVALGLAACALAQTWGVAGASIGNTIAIQLIVAASIPMATGTLDSRVAGFGLGAGLAAGLALLVWPVRVFKPGRRAIAAVLRGLAAQVALLATHVGGGPGWRSEVIARHRELRGRIEAARVTLAATRGGRAGGVSRGDRLLAIVQLCDQLFGTLVALEELIDAGLPDSARPAFTTGIERLGDALDELAERVLREGRQPAPRTGDWHGLDIPLADDDRAHGEHVLAQVTRAHRDRWLISDLIASLVDDVEPSGRRLPAPEPGPTVRDHLRVLLDLDRRSPVIRHALRVAVAVLITTGLAHALALRNGFWLTTTAYLLLLPHRAATTTRTIQRVLGTVVGGVVAAAILWAVHDPRSLAVVVVVLAGISASVLQLNYLLYAMFLTPTFVLLAERHVFDPSLVGTRIASTLLGGAVALAAGALLWPAREVVRLRARMADALDAAGGYLDAVVAAAVAHAPIPSPPVQRARRRCGLALEDTELALEHVAAERMAPHALEPWMTLVAFARRLGGAIGGLGSSRHALDDAQADAIASFARAITARLGALAAAVRDGEPPAIAAPIATGSDDILLAARLARIAAAVTALTAAATRAAGVDDRAPSADPTAATAANQSA